MPDNSSTPIPVPLRRRGRLFMAKFAPVIIFVVVAVACTQLWRARIVAPTLIALVEQRTAEVRSPVDGQLRIATELRSLQTVEAGEVVAWIQPLSVALTEAEIGTLRRELEALRAHPDSAMDLRRVELESVRLQLEWMQARVDLADLRAQLRSARDTVERFDALKESDVLDVRTAMLARAELEGLVARVEAQATTVESLTPEIDRIEREGAEIPPAAFAIQATLAAQEARLHALELRLAPQPLTAPFDGVVLAHRTSGEHVLGGDSVVTIGATHSSRIIGYERGPGSMNAAVGDLVTVTSRRLPGDAMTATLLEVSPVLEPVPTEILALWRSTLPESGRRYQFSLPTELALLPGERVEITLVPSEAVN